MFNLDILGEKNHHRSHTVFIPLNSIHHSSFGLCPILNTFSLINNFLFNANQFLLVSAYSPHVHVSQAIEHHYYFNHEQEKTSTGLSVTDVGLRSLFYLHVVMQELMGAV